MADLRCHDEHDVSFTGEPVGRSSGQYGKYEPCVVIATTKAVCESRHWPEQHPSDCAWCALVAEETAMREALLNG